MWSSRLVLLDSQPTEEKGKVMSKGEKYSSKKAKMKHEKMEGAKERMKEYGKKSKKKK
jgi:hypothetical protein